jgi:hypothetical protein
MLSRRISPIALSQFRDEYGVRATQRALSQRTNQHRTAIFVSTTTGHTICAVVRKPCLLLSRLGVHARVWRQHREASFVPFAAAHVQRDFAFRYDTVGHTVQPQLAAIAPRTNPVMAHLCRSENREIVCPRAQAPTNDLSHTSRKRSPLCCSRNPPTGSPQVRSRKPSPSRVNP